jgi:hypothetical protein
MPDINSETDMKDFTFGIIETLHNEKKRRGKFPDFVTRNEILQFIKNRVERSLKSLEEEGKLTSGEMMNYDNRYYEINEDTEGSD